MPQRFCERLSGFGIPNSGRLISRSRDDPQPIRAELGRPNAAFMPERFGEKLPGLGIPHTRVPPSRAWPAGCDHAQPIRAELGRKFGPFMPERFGERLSGPYIPHPRV